MGVCERTAAPRKRGFRRYVDRYEDERRDGLADKRLGSGRPTTPSPGGRGGPCAARTRRWCRATNRSKIDLADRAPDRFAAEVQPIERRAGQKLMQAALSGRAEAVEFIRSYHHVSRPCTVTRCD